ncbi:related to GPI anchored dioxygenase [Phialocephala subalpina]|uniref:Related to GPI anchored dioxygenase n=1 Tax=Phialocephala subalpina TaxID=576137 RepID=A0A1L7WX20_9HELO|nr:related to GPI anchored dioxygenase [Phialocephala subalpina]
MASVSRLLAVAVICISLLSSSTSAHPGEHHDEIEVLKEMRERGIEAMAQQAAYSSCADSEESQARQERAVQRRADIVQKLREERGLLDTPFITRRNLAQFKTWEKTSHDKSSVSKLNANSPGVTVFGANLSCILTPDNADGPYYVLGEHIRTNVVENQVGVPMHLDLQFVDVTTCKPLQPLVVDIWGCNATGIYSGVSAAGEGGLNSTFLRGVQQTDKDGVVQFDTLFPGHYQGRATHQHMLTHTGATILPNGTFTGGHISHLSQLFFDTALINAVEATAPYNTNKIPHTTNDADMFTGYSATAAYDPFPNYIMLGTKLSQGLFVWAEIGVKPANDQGTYGANTAYLAADGGHDNPAFNMFATTFPPPTAG